MHRNSWPSITHQNCPTPHSQLLTSGYKGPQGATPFLPDPIPLGNSNDHETNPCLKQLREECCKEVLKHQKRRSCNLNYHECHQHKETKSEALFENGKVISPVHLMNLPSKNPFQTLNEELVDPPVKSKKRGIHTKEKSKSKEHTNSLLERAFVHTEALLEAAKESRKSKKKHSKAKSLVKVPKFDPNSPSWPRENPDEKKEDPEKGKETLGRKKSQYPSPTKESLNLMDRATLGTNALVGTACTLVDCGVRQYLSWSSFNNSSSSESDDL